jgi:6-phosphogluconolactonase
MAALSFIVASRVSGPTGGLYEFSFSGTPTQTNFVAVRELNYIIYSPNHQVVYGSIQSSPIGAIVAYKVTPSGLVLLNTVASGANCPCQMSVTPDAKFLFAANYGENGDSALVQYPLNADGSLQPPSKVIRHSGTPGPVSNRQDGPHIHCTAVTSDGKYLVVTDLGLDVLKAYPLDLDTGIDEANAITTPVEAGSGPRHILLEPDGTVAYVVSELANTVTTFKFSEGVFTQLKKLSTLPSSFRGNSAASAVKFSPDRKALLASNRGADSIAIYAIDNKGGIELSDIVDSLGQGPRDFGFIEGSNVVVVANLDSGRATLFDYAEYTLKPTADRQSIAVPQPLGVI